MKEWFLELIDYDLWANRLWIEALANVDPELVGADRMRQVGEAGSWPDCTSTDLLTRASHVLAHTLRAHRIWVERCTVSVQSPTPGTAEQWLEWLNVEWRKAVEARSPDEPIDYRTSRGEAFTNSFLHIFTQAMNHGTYHRGQLREMAEAADLEFPETDFIGFVRTR